MNSSALQNFDMNDGISNDNCCDAALKVSSCGRQTAYESITPNDGCIFKVGNDMYFVPTQPIMGEDMLYITCDAQKIGENAELAGTDVEDAILGQLKTKPRSKQGEAFVITRDRKTFRL